MAKPVVTTRILRRLLAVGVDGRASRLLSRIHPADLGPLLAELTSDELRSVIDLLSRQGRAASVLRELPPELFPEIIAALPDERLATVLAGAEVDDLLELIDALPEERREPVRELLPEEQRAELNKVELYPPRSAGRAMTTSYLALDQKMSAQEAIDSIRAVGEALGSILYLYVVDEDGRLQGVVPIRRLVAAPPDTPCADFMSRDPVRVSPDAPQEEAAQLVARYDLLAIPVTAADGTMLGVITVDDVIDVIHEEATEDMYHLAGLSEEDRVFTSPSLSIRKRVPWMFLNLGTVFAAAWVVGLFENTLEQVVTLALFLPVVAGLAGNGGIQALTVTTRGIALGEIEFSSGLRAVGKELAVGLAIGLMVGTLGGLVTFLWQGNAFLGLVLFLSMLLTMTVAGLMGAAVPLALKALRLDPALGAGVIVTFFADAFGIFCFLGIATLLLDRIA